jgi:LPXTG-site transpeptidase (sortase) family protein
MSKLKLAILITGLILVAIIIAVVVVAVGKSNGGILGIFSPERTVTEISDPDKTISADEQDYDFTLGSEQSITVNSATGSTDSSGYTLLAESQITRLQIPVIGVDTPVIMGLDGNSAIEHGTWMYPASRSDKEKILFGHRRKFGQNSPLSFWRMDELNTGDLIYLVDNDGHRLAYTVQAQAVTNGSDMSILNVSGDDIVKLVSCSTVDGSAGSAEYRLITIARRA